ncbi:S-adenosyl-L-methionine-dependent methyltransferase [Fagus crenata]|jgi:cephalosporin hydroxylase
MKQKEDQQVQHRQKRLIVIALKLAKPTAYFVLLLLTYTLGYLSSSPYYNNNNATSLSSLTSTPIPTPPTPTIQDLTNLPSQLDHFRLRTHCADPLPPQLVRQTILNRVYNATSPFDNFPPAHVSTLLRTQRIKGWGSNGAVFENLINKIKPRTIIEVGTFLGASAIHMAGLTRQLGLQTLILCIDDFRGWPGFRDRFKDIKMVNGDVLLMYQFMQNLVSVNATDYVLPVPFSTASGLDMLCELGVYADLIEVDAGHDFISAWSDINRAYRLLRPGGVIFGHDYFTAADDRGVRRAVNLFARIHGFKIKLDGQHWVIDST